MRQHYGIVGLLVVGMLGTAACTRPLGAGTVVGQLSLREGQPVRWDGTNWVIPDWATQSNGRYALAPLPGAPSTWTWVLDTQTGQLTAYELRIETRTLATGDTLRYSYIDEVGKLSDLKDVKFK